MAIACTNCLGHGSFTASGRPGPGPIGCPRCNWTGSVDCDDIAAIKSEAHGRLVSRLHGIAWRLDQINQDPQLSEVNAVLVQAAAKLVDDALAEAGAR